MNKITKYWEVCELLKTGLEKGRSNKTSWRCDLLISDEKCDLLYHVEVCGYKNLEVCGYNCWRLDLPQQVS